MTTLKKLPESEFELMKIVWANPSPISTNQILEKLDGERKWKPQTVLTLLTRLIDREFLRSERVGKERIVWPDGTQAHGRVGGGGAPGVPLPGFAVRLPESAACPLRTGTPAVLARVHDGATLVDLRCIPENDDQRVADAVRAATEPR